MILSFACSHRTPFWVHTGAEAPLLLLVHQSLVDPQVFLPSVEPKLSHFLMPPFLELWTSLTLLLSYQPYYCSECPEGQALWRCSSFLRSSNCCCRDFSSVVRHNLFQPYSLFLLLTCFLVLANTPPTNS